MIGLYNEAGTRLAIGYNGVTLNNPSELPFSKYEVNDVTSLTSIDYIREGRPTEDGSIRSVPRKPQRVIRLRGMVRASSYAGLFDAAAALASATDPSLMARVHGDTYTPDLTFSVPTLDTTTWPTGLIPCRYSGIALGTVDATVSQANGMVVPFSIDLFLADPRRYSQSQGTRSGAGTATNSGDYITYPTVTIAMTGAGSASYAVGNSTVGKTVTLNLSGCVNGDSIVVYMDRYLVTKNGTPDSSLIVGTPGWFYLLPGANTITLANTTNATTTTNFYVAWCD
jgi:hypothetical protein